MQTKRPTAITVICFIGFIGAFFALPLIFSATAKQIGPWYPPYLATSVIIGLISMYGLWQMKKWGILLYAGFAAFNQVALVATGLWNILALILPAIVVAIGLSKFKQMQ